MKKLTFTMCILVLILGTAGAVNALPFSYLRSGTTLFTGDSLSAGFHLGDSAQVDPDTLKLSISFSDFGEGSSAFSRLFVNGSQRDSFQVNNSIRTWNLFSGNNFNINVLDIIGKFRVDWIEFCGNTHDDNPPAPVPEPSTILLLGTGLMGLVVASRKKLKK